MRIVDLGSGPPVVAIPGVQGRWEWMRPGIQMLATRCRVITFSLSDEPGCGGTFDEATGFDCYVEQVRDALDQTGLETAAIFGVSYGGLVAAAFAARYPERTQSLVLVSPLPPSWTPDERARLYLRAPRLLSPLFCIGSLSLVREIAVAHPGLVPSLREAVRHGWNVATHMFSPSRMARRVRLLERFERPDLARVEVPTLLVTGDPALDSVIPVRASREYLRLIPHARYVTVDRTGHLGFITRAAAFVEAVAPFVDEAAAVPSGRRVV